MWQNSWSKTNFGLQKGQAFSLASAGDWGLVDFNALTLDYFLVPCNGLFIVVSLRDFPMNPHSPSFVGRNYKSYVLLLCPDGRLGWCPADTVKKVEEKEPSAARRLPSRKARRPSKVEEKQNSRKPGKQKVDDAKVR